MRNYTTSELLLFAIGIIFFSACQNEAIEPYESTIKAYSGTTAARAALNELYTKGLPALYFSADQDKGIPLAWGAYLSGLFESECDQGYYPALANQELSSPSVRELAHQIDATCFDGIEAADTFISQIPNTTGLKPVERAILVGEAKFFRAFDRFYLIRAFGSYPEKQAGGTLLIQEAAYAKVVKDLQEAIACLPQKSFVENKSHITGFIARALLGEVYLQMSGYPLQKDKYAEAAAILRPIIQSDKHHLAAHGTREDLSAFNMLRTTPTNDEYLYSIYGENTTTRSAFSFPKAAKNWGNIKEQVAFNAFKPTHIFMACYSENDLRGKDRQFFHTFFKVKEEGKIIFEIFDPAPYFWLTAGTESPAPAKQIIGLYRYAEILLMAAEAIVRSEGVTPEAIGYLTQVRVRSTSVSQAELEQSLSTLTKEKFLQEIWMERLRELPFEMKQLFDIVRTNFYPVYKDSALQFVSLKEARTPQGRHLSEGSLVLPRITL